MSDDKITKEIINIIKSVNEVQGVEVVYEPMELWVNNKLCKAFTVRIHYVNNEDNTPAPQYLCPNCGKYGYLSNHLDPVTLENWCVDCAPPPTLGVSVSDGVGTSDKFGG